MAQFRGTLKGTRGQVSRLGHRVSGLESTVNSWKSGVYVRVFHRSGVNYFEVYRTTGSLGASGEKVLVASWQEGGVK